MLSENNEIQDADLFYRKDERFAHTEIIDSGKKRPASVENLDRTLLTLFQQDFFDLTRQKELIEKKDRLAPILLEEFCKNFIERETNQYLSSLPLTCTKEDATAHASKLYKEKERLITTLIEKEAWKQVLLEAIPEESLTKRFRAREVLKIANVNETNMQKLEDIVLGVQKKMYRWVDRSVNIKKGEIVEETPQGTLWPYSKLVRSHRRGSDNYIDIKVERELIQYVLFLHKNFVKYRLYISTSLKNPNATRTYEVLVESLTPKYKDKYRDVDELMREFGVNYKEGSDFLSKVVYVSVKKINKLLGTNITIKKSRSRKKINKIFFLISDADKKILIGDDSVWRADAGERDTFGYFIALQEYFQQPFDTFLLAKKSKEYNGLIESDRAFAARYRELYDTYLENTDAFDELLMLHDQGKLPYGLALDLDLRVLVGSDGAPVAETAISCLAALKEKENIAHRTPSLFELEEQSSPVWTPADYIPFEFQLTKARTVTVDKNNYDQYAQKIVMAVNMGRLESFTFASAETAEKFKREFFPEEGAIEAQVVEEPEIQTFPVAENENISTDEADAMSVDAVAEMLHAMFKRRNEKTRSGVNACKKVVVELLEDTGGEPYELRDIVMVVNWLEHVDPHSKKPFYSNIVKTHTQFKKNFEQMYAESVYTDRSPGGGRAVPDVNILDALENS